MASKQQKLHGILWLALTIGIAAGFGLGAGPLIKMTPWSWEKALSRTLSFEPKICKMDEKSGQLFANLIQRIYPLDDQDAFFAIEVQAVPDSSINAYASLGGKIYLHSGLFTAAESAEEIAGVLAHEIEHVKRRHILEAAMIRLMTSEGIKFIFGISNLSQLSYFLGLSFSRAQEMQADIGALQRLQKAKVSNDGFKQFFQRLEKDGLTDSLYSDHPSNEVRKQKISEYTNTDTSNIMSTADWKILKGICN